MSGTEMLALQRDPHFYLYGFDAGDALFLRMNRDCYARSIFFDDRIVTLDDQLIRVPWADLAALPRDAGAPELGWIFHMAHTGSTLLARALEQAGRTLVIREPVTLRSLGVEAGAAGGDAAGSEAWQRRLDVATAMLARRFAGDDRVVVKTNVPVNAIIAALLAASAQPRGVLLHFGLDDYLTAILRSPNHRGWVERIFAEMRIGALPEVGAAAALETAEKAAALWLFQVRAYAAALAANPGLCSLDANMLFDAPQASLSAAARYFGSPLSDAAAGEIVAGPLFSTYSKNPNAAFDNRQRKARIAATRAELGAELERARRWIAPRVAELPLPERLAQPLYGENAPLL